MTIHYDLNASSLIFGDVKSLTKLQVPKSSSVTIEVASEPVPEFMITRNDQEVKPMDSKLLEEYNEEIEAR